MIRLTIFYTIIVLLTSTVCCSQEVDSTIHKVEVDDIMNIYYCNTDGHLIQKNKDSTIVLFHKVNMEKFKFFQYSTNSNFILKNDFALSLRVERNGLFCATQAEFDLVPWETFFECRNTKTLDKIKIPKVLKRLPSSLTPLNIENKASMFWSKNHIHFDFIHFKKNVLMLILVDNILHVYENIGPINNNEWKLIKSLPSNMQVPFQTYVNDSERIIVQFNPDNIFQLDLQEKFLKRVRQKPKANQCLIYDHQSEKYFWITQQQVKKLITSKKPNEFIQSILDHN